MSAVKQLRAVCFHGLQPPPLDIMKSLHKLDKYPDTSCPHLPFSIVWNGIGWMGLHLGWQLLAL